MNKCIGCGITLQTEEKNNLGYTTNIEKKLCERCFRIRNYGEYKTVTKYNNLNTQIKPLKVKRSKTERGWR